MLFALLWIILPPFANWSPNKKSVWFTFWKEALLPTGFWKSLIYQPLPIVSKKLGRPKSGKAIIVIVSPLVSLMGNQVMEAAKLGLCAAQLGLHSGREIMEGNFSLIFGIRILDCQSKRTSYVDINPIPRQPRRHCRWQGTRRKQMVSLHTQVLLLTSTS